MSHHIKAFGIVNKLLDSVIDNTAPIGELSAQSRTFSTQKTNLANPAYENVSTVVFSCKEDGVDKPLPLNTDIYLLSVLEEFIVNFDNELTFDSQMRQRFPDISEVKVGADITHMGVRLPAYVSWATHVENEPMVFTVWFSDAVFATDYDEYEIRVLSPIPNVKDLSQPFNIVQAEVNNYSLPERIAAQETVRNGDPVTAVETMLLKWVDPETETSIEMTWMLLVFGPRGLEKEAQLQAIRDYLKLHTGKEPEEWKVNLPELIVTVTYAVMPNWEAVALRASGTAEYLYSPLISMVRLRQAAEAIYGGTVPDDLLETAEYGCLRYKSIGFTVMPRQAVGAIPKFTASFPDFALVAINDINLGRLSSATRVAIAALESAVAIAETDDNIAALPAGYTRATVDGVRYINYMADGIMYQVAARQQG